LARKKNFAILTESLRDVEDMVILPQATPKSDPSWFGFPITLREGVKIERSALLKELEDRRVGTRLLFAGNLVRQPYMKGRHYRISGELTNSDVVMNRTFWIGLQPALNEDMLQYSTECLKNILKR
jgi:CDP-6-deoxy-D-xylo-4-hexulose-3-dehydrase